MHSSYRFGKRILLVGALLLVVSAVIPAVLVQAASPTTSAAVAEQSKVVLADTSIDGPALWTSNSGAPNLGLASVIAWTGTDAGHSLNLMESSDGVRYGGKITFAESSATRPAVAAQGPPTTIVLAWTGMDSNHTLNLICLGPACGGGEKKLTLWGNNSIASPALVKFGGNFLLGFTGTDSNHSLNILPFSLTTAGSGFQVGTKTVLRQLSSTATPNLALNPHNNQLLLSWVNASAANHLSFATSSDGVTWSSVNSLSATSGSAPASYAVADTSLPTYWMAWADTSSSHFVNARFTSSFPFWPISNATTFSDTALGGPVLGYVGTYGQTLLAWTSGDVGHHLTIATLTAPGVATLDQRIDSYLANLSTNQLIGQTLMVSVCAYSYTTNLNQALTQWHVGNAIIYTSCNGGPTEPTTLAGLQQLTQALQSHADRPMIIGIDEEGGTVDRLAPYYGATPGARSLANTGNPQNAYNQAQTDAARMRANGLNTDFAPVADVDQGGGEGPSRMFGTTDNTVITYAGAFLDGLQQHGVVGSLKHWPGLGAATGNPDFVLPTINQSQSQMNAIDFPPFGALLSHQPGMVMVTTVMAPAYDSHNPAMLSPTLVNGVLRGQLGFQGVVITDALGAQGLITYMQQQGYSNAAQGIAEASVRAFLAGDDLLLCPLPQSYLAAVVTAMQNAVASGRISRARLLQAAHRIIRLKVEMGVITLP